MQLSWVASATMRRCVPRVLALELLYLYPEAPFVMVLGTRFWVQGLGSQCWVLGSGFRDWVLSAGY